MWPDLSSSHWGVKLSGVFSQTLDSGTHRGFGFDHMIWVLAAAAVFHGIPRILIEDNAEEENKRTLEDRRRR